MDYLAYDLGASSGKLFRGMYDGSRLTLETVHRFDNAVIPLTNGLYWDFLSVWRNLCLGIQKASRECTIRSIGVDSFCNDFSFIDQDGELLSPMRAYRDARTIRCGEAIYEKMSQWQLYQETGNQIAYFNTLMQLAAMRREQKDVLLDDAHRLLFLADLIAYYLTGEELAERTVSSVSQMYRFDAEDWSDLILETFRIPRRLFGTLTDSATLSGRTTQSFCKTWGLEEFDFISVCQHDTASAFLAVPGSDDRAIISCGTWSLVGCENNEPIINDYGFQNNIANEGSLPGHHRLLRNVMGSWLLQELRSEYLADGHDYSYARMEELAKDHPAFGFLIDVDDPRFFSPGDMRQKIRESCWSPAGGQPETVGQFVRCIYESLALKHRWAVEKLEILTGRRFPMISIIGGGSKDALTCRMTASACGRPVIAGPSDASALGNILAQLLAYCEIRDVAQGRELIRNSFSSIQYDPAQSEQWEQVYGEYVEKFHLQ